MIPSQHSNSCIIQICLIGFYYSERSRAGQFSPSTLLCFWADVSENFSSFFTPGYFSCSPKFMVRILPSFTLLAGKTFSECYWKLFFFKKNLSNTIFFTISSFFSTFCHHLRLELFLFSASTHVTLFCLSHLFTGICLFVIKFIHHPFNRSDEQKKFSLVISQGKSLQTHSLPSSVCQISHLLFGPVIVA